MKEKQLTVADLSQLIAAREEIRAELHLLALDARERWRALEAKLHELEERLDRGLDGEHRGGFQTAAATDDSRREPTACPLIKP
jgi:BMFP domain-containing protein YqiC